MGQAFPASLDDAAQNDSTSGVLSSPVQGRLLRWTRFGATSDTSPGFKIIVEETYNRSIRLVYSVEKPVITLRS